MVVQLRVLCWDHPRCTGPTEAAAVAYRMERSDIRVECTRRPLASFNDDLPSQLTPEQRRGVDLIYIDHPMVAAIAAESTLVPLDELLAPEELLGATAGAIGATSSCYALAGRQWALGADAACQVSARNTEKLAHLQQDVPRSWPEVLDLARRQPSAVGLPLTAADAMCTLISLSANARATRGQGPHWLDEDAAQFLTELVQALGRDFLGVTPADVLARLAAAEDDLAYVPYLFGYTITHRGAVAFGDVPGRDGRPLGAVLGGAGLGVLATSSHQREAARFAAWLMQPRVQHTVLAPAGGQPPHASLWEGQDPGSFAASTVASLRSAYQRPRQTWWPQFHARGGARLLELLADRGSATEIVTELQQLADDLAGLSVAGEVR